MKNKERYYKYKVENNKNIILIKSGKFYKTYDVDAFILNKIFSYKIKDNSVGFPETVLFEVINKLNEKGLNVFYINNDVVNKFCVEQNLYDKYYEQYLILNEVNYFLEDLVKKIKVLLESDISNYYKIKKELLKIKD